MCRIKPFWIAYAAILYFLPNVIFAKSALNDLTGDGPPKDLPDMSHVADAVPKVEKIYPISLRPYTIRGKDYEPLKSALGYVEQGVASWYGTLFHGRKTAMGDKYDMFGMTAAHKTLPLPTYVRVTNLENDLSIVVRVNDRGPFHSNRVIDLSYSAASRLDMLDKGTALVEVSAIDPRLPQLVDIKKKPVLDDKARIYLQLASFGSEEAAITVRAQMQRYLKRPVIVDKAKTEQGKVYRVQVGPINSLELADKVSEQLLQINVYQLQMHLR